MGQPVTIDANGIHQSDPSAPPSPLNTLLGGVSNAVNGSLNDALAAAGIRITYAGPVQQSGANAGLLGSDGVRIDLEVSQRTMLTNGSERKPKM